MSLHNPIRNDKLKWKGINDYILKNIGKKTLSQSMTRSNRHDWSSNLEEAPLYTSFKASMTLETAIALPLFIFFMAAILFLFRVLEIQQNVEEALEYAARQTAISAHVKEETELFEGIQLTGFAKVQFAQALERLDTPLGYVDNGMLGFSFLESDTQGEYVNLIVDYTIRNPISFLGLFTYQIEQCAKSHKWTGNVREDDEQAVFVYITETGSVYHLSRNCTYLALSIRSIPEALAQTDINLMGKKYRDCELCRKEGMNSNGIVYVTDYGDACHNSLSCSGLKRTIYTVRLEELEGYWLCSKCAK